MDLCLTAVGRGAYIRKVERVRGKLQHSVIATYPNVSQFWKYKPEEFLKIPLYTRDYPPCRSCRGGRGTARSSAIMPARPL